jgi:YVTN family beta-propeller protein
MHSRKMVRVMLATALVAAACTDTSTGNQTGASFSQANGNGNANGNCKPPKTHPVGSIIGTVDAPAPWGVAVRDDGLTYFTAVFQSQLGVTNTTTRTITGFINVGNIPTGVAFSPDGTRAYSANQSDATVSVVDVASSTSIATISTGGAAPFSVEVSPDGLQLFVGNNDNTMLIIDTQSFAILKTVIVGFATNAFAIEPSGRFLYASSFVSGTVSEIDMFTGNVTRTFMVGGTPQGLAVSRKGTNLFVANEAGYVNDVDLTTGDIGAQIPLASGGFGVGVTPDDKQAWIAIPNTGQVQVLDMKKKQITGSLNVGGNPRRLAFSDAGNIGAVTNLAGYISFVK